MLKKLFTGITSLSLRFKWITIGIAALFLVLGVIAASQMNQELIPAIEFPQTFIFTIHPGASSEDLLELVTKPLEKEITTLKGVIPEGLESTTTSPISFLIVRNEYGVNSTTLRAQIQQKIDAVMADGVPKGLKTTADLTPAIMTKVLTLAPSMFDDFSSNQLLAMQPDVLDAALAVNPAFVDKIDVITHDQLAAQRVDASLSGTKIDNKPVDLPGAWIVTDDTAPQIKTFDLTNLPVTVASVFSTDPKVTSAQLKDLVNKELVADLKSNVPGLADIQISGGQQIPQEVRDAAQAAIARMDAAQPATTPSTDQSATQPASSTSGASGSTQPAAPVDANGVPLMPASWGVLPVSFVIGKPMKTADDLFTLTDSSGAALTAAQVINRLADAPALIRQLSGAVIKYAMQKESTFADQLSPKVIDALSAEAYAAIKNEKVAPALTGAWVQLANQKTFKTKLLDSARDLLKLDGGAAATLNAIVKNTPASLQSFAIRLVSSLTPDTVDYLATYEDGFLAKLDPQVLRYMSADTLKSISTFIDGLKDDSLKADLKAIIADPSKAAAASLKDTAATQVMPDDPNAPLMPASWSQQLGAFGVTVNKADDLLRNPFGMKSAADFINLLSDRGAAKLMSDLTPDVLLYLQAHEPTFFAALKPSALGQLSKETLAKLPPDVSARATSGVAFTPDTTITRTNGQEALTLSFYKESDQNTVVVADSAQKVLDSFLAAHKDINIITAFEQAGFIKESIGGVTREGGLGAVMAVIVILLFLNFSFRSTLVTAVSIPTSIAIAFVLMRWVPGPVHDFLISPGVANALPEAISTFLLRLFPGTLTLNIMTLSGLTVAIGRVVDDSIVVLENIYRQIQKGADTREAVIKGTRDVSVAIFAATLTTVVVFLPIGLAGGIVGEFFLPFGLAVTYSLVASFLVAITIVPVLAFLFIKRKEVNEEKEGRLESTYHVAIDWALNHRWAVLGLATLTLAFGIYLLSLRPTSFLPAFGEPQISVSVSMPAGTPIAQTDARVRTLETYLASLKGQGVAKYQVIIGSGGGIASFVGGGGVDGTAAQVTIGVDGASDDTKLTALTEQIRGKAAAIFGSEKNATVSKATLSDQGFGGFAVVLTGPQAELVALNDAVIKTLSTVPGLANVTSTLTQAAQATSTTYLRINQTASVTFSAELETQDAIGVTSAAIAKVQAMPDIPPDVTVGEGFQSEQQTQGFADMGKSLGIAVIIVYLVMVITFASLVHPFTILFSLPLAIVGAALGLTISNRTLGMSAMIGLLMLIGIVVTNAIVLIDRVQQNRKEQGMKTREALVEGGRTRLRPILMTAIATMFALTPLAIGLSQGTIIAAELGTVVIGGLFSSTLLTLLVVPVVFSLLDAAQHRILGGRKTEAPAVSGD